MHRLLKITGSILVVLLSFGAGCFEDGETGNFPPNASFSVTPNTGNLQTIFVFDASASSDAEDATSDLMVRWDFNGDGSWETDWIYEKQYSIQYVDETDYEVYLEVRDTEGLTAQTNKVVSVGGGSSGDDTFTDPRDHTEYTMKQIGNQIWMTENLKYNVSGSHCYDNSPAKCAEYGRLYTWEQAMNACPDGWHLPTENEWVELELYLGLSVEESYHTGWRGDGIGDKMKSVSGWNDNGNGTNESGLNVIPAGFYQYFQGNDEFGGIEISASFWTSTEASYPNYSYGRTLLNTKTSVKSDTHEKSDGYSVRCVKD